MHKPEDLETEESEVAPHGRYLVAPDSTPPVATTLFKDLRVTLVVRSIERLNKMAEHRHLKASAAMFDFTEGERERLVSQEGAGADTLLKLFESTNAQAGASERDRMSRRRSKDVKHATQA